MDITLCIRLRAICPEAVIKKLILELPDGTDRILTCDSPFSTQHSNGITEMFCRNLILDSGRKPGHEELAQSRILDIELNGSDVNYIREFEAWIIIPGLGVTTEKKEIRIPMKTYDDTFPSAVNWPNLTREERSVVHYFKTHGMTVNQCLNRPDEFWVSFTPDTSPNAMYEFMAKHTRPDEQYQSAGKFVQVQTVKRHKNGHTNLYELRYEAPDVQAAMADLKKWKEFRFLET